MLKRYTIAAVATLAVGGMLTACVATGPATQTPTPTAASATPTPTPSQTPTLDVGQQQAAGVVVRYHETLDQIFVDGAPLDSLYEAASGEVAREQLRLAQQSLGAGYLRSGRTGVDVRDVQGASAPYVVQACIDISEVTVVDSQGRSVAQEGQPTHTLWQYTVEDINGRLLVMEKEAVASPC